MLNFFKVHEVLRSSLGAAEMPCYGSGDERWIVSCDPIKRMPRRRRGTLFLRLYPASTPLEYIFLDNLYEFDPEVLK